VHCRSQKQAQYLLDKIREQLARCKLVLHPGKTKIVYCKDEKRTERFEHEKFDFLGFTFRSRLCRTREGRLFPGFSPAVSNTAKREIRQKIRRLRVHLWTKASLDSIAHELNPVIRGWINYYGKFYRSELRSALNHLDQYLIRWVQGKYRKLQQHKLRAIAWLKHGSKSGCGGSSCGLLT
jgi:RNA-directed DNA polymerase